MVAGWLGALCGRDVKRRNGSVVSLVVLTGGGVANATRGNCALVSRYVFQLRLKSDSREGIVRAFDALFNSLRGKGGMYDAGAVA